MAQTDTGNPPAEEILYRARTHPKVLFAPLCLLVLGLAAIGAALHWMPTDTSLHWFNVWARPVAVLVLLAAVLVWCLWPFLRWRNAWYTVTTHRVAARWGVIYRDSREIDLTRIASIDSERGILDRLVGCGTIVVHDAAMARPLYFRDVPRFNRTRQFIDEARYRSHTAPYDAQDRINTNGEIR